MKTTTKFTALFAFLLFFLASGCDTLNTDTPEVASLSEEDAEIASELIANTLSDESEGLMSDITDLRADVEGNQLNYRHRRFWRVPGLRPCRGENREYNREYNAETGTHTVTYSRQADTDKCTKSVSATLNYQFLDDAGNFIETPRASRDSVDTINFDGTREGAGSHTSRSGVKRTSSFSQTATWSLTGANDPVGSLSGEMSSEGSYLIARGDSASKEGTYSAQLSAVDVTISQQENEEDDIERLVTGTLQYSISVTRIVNGETTVREGEGTIELEGNGKALLRFLGLRKVYRINLASGEVENDDDNDDDGDGED